MKTLTFQQLGRYGRLGNQMFQIASTIGIAKKNGWGFAFPEWKNYDHLDRFQSTEDIDVQKYFCNPLPVYTGPKLPESFVHWGYWPINLRGANDISLNGHMQSEKYFLNCQDTIRFYFKMKDEYPDNDLCAIHVRLGDYDDNYHPRQKWDYYRKAMESMPSGTQFRVYSDEINKAWNMFPAVFNGKSVQFVTKSDGYMDEFKSMKACRHFIIGNSTYSWWAAWLGNQPGKKVIAPSNWFGPIANLKANDLYCGGWQII